METVQQASFGGRASGTYTFGHFRLDPWSRVLTHDGREVPLRPTVFALLLHLVENPDRVVGKDELFSAVWRRRSVEEANLTQTVSALRSALRNVGGADAEAMIATSRGAGYRFCSDVRWEPGEEPVSPASPVTIDKPLALPASRQRITPWRRAAGLVVVLIAAAAMMLLPSQHSLRPENAVVLADFDNRTREAIFDRTLTSVLRIDLSQSPFVTVQPEKTTRDTLVLMTRPRDALVTTELAQEVCVRTGADAVLAGAIGALGRQYIATLTATDCSGRKVLAQEKAEVAGREAVVPALDDMIGQVRRKLGEPIASINRFDVPLVPARTASIDALRAYSEGMWLNDHGRQAEAIAAQKQAIMLDPTFAAAWAALGVAAAIVNDVALSDRATARAYALRSFLNVRQALGVEMLYMLISRQDVLGAIGVLQRFTAVYPNDMKGWTNLANAELYIGRYVEARRDAEHSLALHADLESTFVVAMKANLGLGQAARALAIGRTAEHLGLDGDSTHRELMEVALLQRDPAALNREMRWAARHPGVRVLLTEAEIAYARAFSDQYAS